MNNLFFTRNSFRTPKIIAHRGAIALEPENSLPAFDVAGRMGAWAIETDVYKTRDGRLVCFHNKKLDGCTDGEGEIAEWDFDALRRLSITAGSNLAAHTPDELRIPTFEEYLKTCRKYGAVAFIHLKMAIAEETLRDVRRMGMEDYCVYSSVKLEHIEEARALSESVFIHHIFSDEANIPALVNLGYSGMSFKIPNLDDVPEGLVDRVHEAGVKICFRTADTPDIMRRAIDMGVDYVPSNYVYTLT